MMIHNLDNKEGTDIEEWLKQAGESGVRLYLEGKPSTAEEIRKRCVSEEAVYMPDYILDENGRIEQIRYDRIPNRN